MAKLDLTPNELTVLAHACRIAASQAEEKAAVQESPSVRKIFEGTAKSYRALGETLAAVAKAAIAQSGNSHQKSDSRRW